MFSRNRELTWELVACGIITLVASACAFRVGLGMGLLVLGLCLSFCAICLFFARWRYRRLKKLSEDLELLLYSGKPLPIQDYNEGELSVLGSQIQKMTIRLMENSSALEQDKQYLADSMADISHQLRTPLTAMHLTAAMLSSSDLTHGRRQELTVELKNLLTRTGWLVESLLKLSRLDAGVVQFACEPMAVQELIRRAAEPLTIPMELREQRLVTDSGNAMLRGDMVWTAEALGNVLKNAVEHTPPGGTITITAKETALFTCITVEDTGPGFDREDLPRLFERFYKGKEDAGSGYGIGLALARRIVAAQNGTIQASNGPEGAVFTLKFYKQII